MYGGPQARDSGLQPVYQGNIDNSSGLQGLAKGLAQASDATDKVYEKQSASDAFALETQVKADWLNADTELRKRHRGANVAGYTEAVQKWWDDTAAKHAENASPRTRELVGRSLGAYKVQAMGAAAGYASAEQERQLDQNYVASQTVGTQAAVRDINPVNAEAVGATTIASLNKSVAAYGATKGWTTEQVQAEQLKWGSNFHAEAVSTLLNTNPGAADKYLKANRDDIDGRVYAQLTAHLKATTDAVAAYQAADTVIAKAGGFADGKPVELDKLEADARAMFPSEPEKAKAAISEIRSRAQVFNSAENERAAANIGTVMGAFGQGASLAAIRRMPQFMALTGDKQAQIDERITNIQIARGGRDIQEMERAQHRLKLKGFAAYEQYSNPATLDAMSEAQVAQLLPVLGNELTDHLLQKKRAIVKNDGKNDGKVTATIDNEDFNHVAQTMGLRPFESNKSEDQKANLGELKYRVEQLINQAQVAKKGALTRDEKAELMRQEMARTVKVGGWFFDDTKPVIQLTADEIKKVVIPPADRQQIAQALAQMYSTTGKPEYTPTYANMRRFYLLNRSRSASLLPFENTNADKP